MGLPFSFNITLFFRLLLPGFVVAGALFPALRALFDNSLLRTTNSEYIIGLSSIIIGWFFVVCNMHVYMVLEGRRYWPNSLKNYFLKTENERLKKLIDAWGVADKTKDKRTANELATEFRRFPVDKNTGKYIALFPTRLGNLIGEYEQYPSTRYSINSIFYWYRIWLVISEDMRNHLDNQQSYADSAAYVTIALCLDGLILIIYSLLSLIPINPLRYYLPEASILLFLALGFFVSSYIFYRSSLHLYAGYGELYKSMFDIYRDKIPVDDIIDQIVTVTDNKNLKDISKSEKYKTVWSYLQHYQVNRNGVIEGVIPNDQLKFPKLSDK